MIDVDSPEARPPAASETQLALHESGRLGLRATILRMVRDATAVLAAILVAFGLDAGWEASRDRGRTEALLVAITTEFDRAVVELDSIVSAGHRGVSALRLLGTLEPLTVEDDRASAAGQALTAIGSIQLYEGRFGALAALLATGGLEDIGDPSLQASLGAWSGDLDATAADRQAVADALLDLTSSLVARDLMDDLFATQLDREPAAAIALAAGISRAPELQQHLARVGLWLSRYVLALEQLRTKAAANAEALRT